MSQAKLYQDLESATDPAQRRGVALQLLAATRRRQYIEAALSVLEDTLDESCHAILHQKTGAYFDKPDQDKAGLIRERLIRLLGTLGHPDDHGLYLQGLATYHRQPAHDVAQNLRAASLLGLEGLDIDLACVWAVRLLGEPDTSQFNCEPSITAIDVLARRGQALPIYQFVLLRGEDFIESGRAEAVGRALEMLDPDFPLYEALVLPYVERDIPVISSGIVSHIIAGRRAALYPLLRRIATTTRHADLHRFTLVMLASARDSELVALLCTLVEPTPTPWLAHFTDVLDLLPDEGRGQLLGALEPRLG